MSLDMFAFSLGRSEAFAKPRDVLKYRAPAEGKGLPSGPTFYIGGVELPQVLPENQTWDELILSLIDKVMEEPGPQDLGAKFLDSKYVIPGSNLLHRWCGHPNLHGWMRRRWRMLCGGKPNQGFDFNTRVTLDVQALDALEHAVKHRQLPVISEPFCGFSNGSEQADDLAFIEAARKELAAGKFVYFTSWW